MNERDTLEYRSSALMIAAAVQGAWNPIAHLTDKAEQREKYVKAYEELMDRFLQEAQIDWIMFYLDHLPRRVQVAAIEGSEMLRHSRPTKDICARHIHKMARRFAHKMELLPEKQCDNCNISFSSERTRNKMCGRCKAVWYCSKACQREHWTAGGHKKECRSVAEQMSEIDE